MKSLLALSLAVLLAGCAGTDSPGTGTPSGTGAPSSTATGGSVDEEIEVGDNRFEDNVTVAKGAAVRYTNEGERSHTVTIHRIGEPTTQLRLDETLSPGESVTYTFADAGTYHVWCRFHGTMTSGMASVVEAE